MPARLPMLLITFIAQIITALIITIVNSDNNNNTHNGKDTGNSRMVTNNRSRANNI